MDEKQSAKFSEAAAMMSQEEMTNMTAALKDPEFRKLLAEYCNEMADPKNQALYEQELTQYEAERGIDLTFITPEPGFVIKTVVDGREKAFINVSRNAKVDRPTSHYACDTATGRRGLQWSIPLTQAPPRHDYDNKKQKCTVYDVVFNPDTLHLAARNREFRQLVISTACDAVESAFQVTLDRANIRFPKMSFKGTARPTVIRKKVQNPIPINRSSSSEECESLDDSSSFTEQFYPKVDMSALNGDRAPTVIKGEAKKNKNDKELKYTTPKYKLVHRRGVDMHEMTHERDAKLNTTLPKELVVTVELPLLKTSQHVKLDVRERQLVLTSDEQGAKYKLELSLPYAVLEDEGGAQFDSGKRQLTVTLPVDQRKVELKLGDLTRVLTKQTSGDSGVDSPSCHSHSSDEEINFVVPQKEEEEEEEDKFLDPNTAYQLPSFTANVLDNDVVFTLNVKNVDPSSVEAHLGEDEQKKGVHVKFFSVGSGYAPSHYAFYVQFEDHSVSVLQHSAEAWDNNVVLQLELNAVPEEYLYGRSSCEMLARGHLKSSSSAAPGANDNKTETVTKNQESHAFGVQVREVVAREMTIELSSKRRKGVEEKKENHTEEDEEDVFHEPHEEEEEEEENKENKAVTSTHITSKARKQQQQQQQKQDAAAAAAKKANKKKRKGRSLSESDLKQHHDAREEQEKKQQLKEAEEKIRATPGAVKPPVVVVGGRKARSVSESGGDILDANGNLFHFKGILKRKQSLSISESCSSMDDQVAVSFDMGVGSFGGIPEEEHDDEEDSDHPVGSEKKHVTFNDVIKKQLFRADSSIVGRRLKNLKKRAKKRAEGRRFSESENSEGEDKQGGASEEASTGADEDEDEGEEGNVRRRDSGIDFDVDDETSNGGLSHEEDGEDKKNAGGAPSSAAAGNKKKKRKGKSGSGGEGGNRKAEVEFKSGMIFNLEM